MNLTEHSRTRLANVRIESSPWIHNVICEGCNKILVQIDPLEARFNQNAVKSLMKYCVRQHQEESPSCQKWRPKA